MDRKTGKLEPPETRILSLSARRAWIENGSLPKSCSSSKSLSARRAWIENLAVIFKKSLLRVALRKESVDRKTGHAVVAADDGIVALRKESVDRKSTAARL